MDRDEILRLARLLGVEAPERRATEELLRTIRRRVRDAMKVLEKSGPNGRRAGGGARSPLPKRRQRAARQRA
jgi:hypothetical protein